MNGVNNTNINDTIQDLAIKVVDGDDRGNSLNSLCELLLPKLKYFVWRYVKDESTINDIVSETFEKMITKFDTYDKKYKFNTWVHRIAQNVALGHINKLRSENMVEIEAEHGGTVEPNYSLEIVDNDFDRLYELTVEAIFGMPKGLNKKIMIETHINNLRGTEVAGKFGLSENTVKTKLRAGRKKIRTYIEETNPVLYSRVKDVLLKK